MGKIPVAYFKGKYIIKVTDGYQVIGRKKIHPTLVAATDTL